MMRRGMSFALLAALVAADLGLIGLGAIMPDLRQKYIFAAQASRVEDAVRAIEAGEMRLKAKTGQYAAFNAVGFAAKSPSLKLNWDSIPSDKFQFDAQILPDRRLRLRALPRGEAVAALNIAPQMFVAELPAKPGGAKPGWYP